MRFSKIIQTTGFALRMSIMTLALVYMFNGCQAEPGPADLGEVKRTFMALRFVAPFHGELRDFNDLELFERSCAQKRVRCEDVLEILKKEDEKFYQTLMQKSR